jgi:translation elongation factor P/translation initiation factor 5A
MFEMDGQLLQVVTVEHIKLARAGAVIKAKLRNLLTGAIFEIRRLTTRCRSTSPSWNQSYRC